MSLSEVLLIAVGGGKTEQAPFNLYGLIYDFRIMNVTIHDTKKLCEISKSENIRKFLSSMQGKKAKL